MKAYKLTGIGLIVCSLIMLSACSSKDSSNSHNGDGGIIGTGGPSQGQALLGPIVNGNVELVRVDRGLDVIVCSTTTYESEDLDLAGTFSFDSGCVEDENALYVVSVSGGSDIDVNDDRILDETPTPVLGSIRVILTGRQLLEGGWKVSAITEAVYQFVAPYLSESNLMQLTEEQLLELTRNFINEDITGDGEINTDDLIVWNPVTNHEQLTESGKEIVQEILSAIFGDYIQFSFTESLGEPVWPIIGYADTFYKPGALWGSTEDTLVVSDYSGFLFYDIKTVDSPSLIGAYSDHGVDSSLVIDGLLYYTKYIGNGRYRLKVVDISMPASPTIVDEYDLDSGGLLYEFNGEALFSANDSRMSLYSVTFDSSMALEVNTIYQASESLITVNSYIDTNVRVNLAYLKANADSCDLLLVNIDFDANNNVDIAPEQSLASDVACDWESGISRLKDFSFAPVYPVESQNFIGRSTQIGADGLYSMQVYENSDFQNPINVASFDGIIVGSDQEYFYTVGYAFGDNRAISENYEILRLYRKADYSLFASKSLDKVYELTSGFVVDGVMYAVSTRYGLVVIELPASIE